ncbi:MAG TPA: flagellar motor control protein ZomB, partial [Mycobacterium sp.]|nr:flagellar motor control protein ZomB [Mycobacterium sp.]
MRYDVTARASLWTGVLVTVVLFGCGAWQRRWISDDGLIVLRTVRNLLAGNGPVFNAGERIEANTSTIWTYLVYLGSWIGGPVRLEYVVLALALGLSLLGMALVMLGTARLYAPRLVGRRALLLPAGALVYIALPPARDFATSGLESGLVLAYLGLLWWMMICWSQAPQGRPAGRGFTAVLAVVAGCSVLVRPELALMGGLALVMMLVAATGWRRRALIVVAGGLLPVAYQIFRMGYYGLLVPGTALAKDATGDKWQQGWIYLANFNRPYALWIPVLLVVILVPVLRIALADSSKHGNSSKRRGDLSNHDANSRRNTWVRGSVATLSRGRLARLAQSPTGVVAFMVVSGLLQALYWTRQGGDFMHARVLLTPVFCLLAPVAVIPLVIPDGSRISRETGYWLAGAVSLLWLGMAGWSLWAANSAGMGPNATRIGYAGIIDERQFYSQATGNAHPLTAADYLDYPRMRAVLVALNNTPDGALLLPSGDYDRWDVVPAIPPPPDQPRTEKPAHTVFFTNLGMVSMNTGLDVRVIDQIGLANPLAAHTARLDHGRIGHDKNIFPDWAVAEG